MKWTPEQKNAVEAPVANILVSAAAGSGKTQVLTGRIIDRVKNGADISRLLVMTFTKAAAAEMRERISKSLAEAAKNEKDKYKRGRLLKQFSLADTADISTVHSFCGKVLKSYFYEIDLDPSFTIMNDYDKSILLTESLSETMDYYYDSADEDFLEFVSLVSGSTDDEEAADMIKSAAVYAMSTPYPEKWLDDAKARYADLAPGNDFFSKPLTEKFIKLVSEMRELKCSIIDYLSGEPELATLYENHSADIAQFDAFLSAPADWDTCYDFIHNKLSLSTFRGGKQGYTSEAKENAQKLNVVLKAVKEEVEALISVPYAEAFDRTERMAKYAIIISEAAKRMLLTFRQKKSDKNVLDYNDLEHFTIKLLSEHDDVAEEVSGLYDEIYVDEYQDTNDTQEEIIRLVSRGRANVFMVGDMKQSIYSFRHTDPERLFAVKSESYAEYCPGCPEKNVKIALSKNFRSNPGIIDTVNTVFKSLMKKRFGGVDYSGTEVLQSGGTYGAVECKGPFAILHTIVSEKVPLYLKRDAEAVVLAQRIKAIMEEGTQVFDKGTGKMRPIRYSDIAVLIRVSKGVSEIYKNRLESAGIPAFSDGGYGFFNRKELSVLISLLKVIDNPLQDVDLIAVLRSPLFNFDENHLAHLALMNKPYFFDAVKESASNEDEPDKKSRRFMAKLNKWREEASFSGVYDFISRLIEEEGYMSYVSSMPDSEIAVANINIFLNYAKKADSSSYKGLFKFLKYIDDLLNKDMADKSDDASALNINAVRIMTIHKSKGLEFPFVFLCDADGGFDTRENTANIAFDKDLGILLKTFYPEREKLTSPAFLLFKEKHLSSQASEEMRILYVALTRAREHLEIIETFFETQKRKAEEYLHMPRLGKIYDSEIRLAKSFSDWLRLTNREYNVPVRNAFRSEKLICEDLQIPGGEHTDEEQTLSQIPDDELINGGRTLLQIPYDEHTDEVLSWQYPKKELYPIKNKYSVSELKSGILPDENEAETTRFLFNFKSSSLARPGYLNSDKVFTSMQKGSIMHYVIEKLDFSSDDILAQIKKMNLTDDERAAVDIDAIRAFTCSDLAKRMVASGKYFREVPFTFKKTVTELDSSIAHDAETLIQGVIDCYFIENGSIVLIDYKTDKNVTDEEAKRRYEKQLSLYAEALTKKYSLPVKEKYLYLFSLKKIIGV